MRTNAGDNNILLPVQECTPLEIESRLYDKFNLTISDVKVLVAHSGKGRYTEAVHRGGTQRRYTEAVDVALRCVSKHICVVPGLQKQLIWVTEATGKSVFWLFCRSPTVVDVDVKFLN